MASEDHLRSELARHEQSLIDTHEEMELIRARYGTDPAKMPGGQSQRYENLVRAGSRVQAQIEDTEARLGRYDTLRRSMSYGYTESGDGAQSEHDAPHGRTRRGDPWKADDDTPAGFVSRAHASLELMSGPATSDRNRIAEMLDRGDVEASQFGRYVVRASHPDYKSAFLKVMRDPAHGHHMWTPQEKDAWNSIYADPEIRRTAMSLTDANGGFLVPFTLDPTVMLTNTGIKDPIRMLARNESTVSDQWQGVTSAGVTAEWTAEASEWADASPTFGFAPIVPKKADAWVQGSYEVLADSNFATQLSRLLADAKARLEGAAFATGNVGATRPRGIIAAIAAVTASIVSSAAINAFAIGDVYRVSDAITPRAQDNISWLANKAILNKIRQFDTTGSSAFWANLGAGIPPVLLGDPAYQVSTMQNAVTTNGLVLLAGDMKEYVIVDRVGMTVLYEPMVKGSNRRPTGEAGYACFWRVGADVTNPDAFRLLQLHTNPTFTALG